MKETNLFDVIIIGGSYAGLSAAMSLGRSLRKVLVIDNKESCNIQTPHSHNFLTQDGKTPKEIATLARQQVMEYKTVEFCIDFATSGNKVNDVFEIMTRSGNNFTGKKLIFATGIKDLLPEIAGFQECWGISVIHCPYCHGYEFRDQKTGIMANGDRAFHLASLVNNLTSELTIFTTGKPSFSSEQVIKLKEHKIKIIETPITNIEHENGSVKKVILQDGLKMDLGALYADVPFKQHSAIPVSLGCELTEQGFLKVNNFQKTTIEGVFACGDNSGFMRSIANAVSTGNITGAVLNKELTDELF